LNIVLLCNSFLPHIGGKELVVYYLAKSYKELGHEVRVVGPTSWFKNRHFKCNFPVHRYPSLIRGKPEKLWIREREIYYQLVFDLKVWGCDVLHAHITYPFGYLAAEYKKKNPNIPLFITPHGNDIHTIPELGHGMRLDPVLNKKIGHALTVCDAVTAISESMATSILDAGAELSKIHNIPNGVDLDRFKKSNTYPDIRTWLNISKNEKIILSVGNYHSRKGQHVLIKAMPEIISKVHNARLILVGRGTEALIPLINELELENHITLTGSIPFPELVDDFSQDYLAGLYNASDIYVSAGVDEGSEGLSLAMLEAMAASTALVATNISGNRELVREGKNGLLIQSNSESALSTNLVALLCDNELREKMSVSARQDCEKYSWLSVAKQYISMYKQFTT